MSVNRVDSYRVLLDGGEGEIVEKKSRFIATIRKCETEEEAVVFIEEMKKKYWDARHNCSAFVIGSRGELTRCSDDGEPQKTAGRPMLDVLLNEGIHNVCVVGNFEFGNGRLTELLDFHIEAVVFAEGNIICDDVGYSEHCLIQLFGIFRFKLFKLCKSVSCGRYLRLEFFSGGFVARLHTNAYLL